MSEAYNSACYLHIPSHFLSSQLCMSNMQDTASQTAAYWKIKRVFGIRYTVDDKTLTIHH